MKKWLGYIDQFILFPMTVRSRIKKCAPDTLFVFTDNALGPWVPLVSDRLMPFIAMTFWPNVRHWEKFRKTPPASRVGCTRNTFVSGYSKGKHFISGSENTKRELRLFLPADPLSSDVVYNGMNQKFVVRKPERQGCYFLKRSTLI